MVKFEGTVSVAPLPLPADEVAVDPVDVLLRLSLLLDSATSNTHVSPASPSPHRVLIFEFSQRSPVLVALQHDTFPDFELMSHEPSSPFERTHFPVALEDVTRQSETFVCLA